LLSCGQRINNNTAPFQLYLYLTTTIQDDDPR
jgi:hypothetical protein